MTDSSAIFKKVQRPRRIKIRFPEILKNIYIILVCLALLFPLVLMLFMSVKDKQQIVYEFFKIAPPFHWENYTTAFGFIGPLIKNSVVMAVLSTVLTVLITSLAAYAFGKLRFPGRNLLFGVLFAKMMLPGILNLIPSFILAMNLRLLDTPWAVVLFCAGTSQPYWVFVMRTFVAEMPIELFEAMRIDGASELRIFGQLAVPMLRPMIALMSINVFVGVWNDYVWPLVTIQTFEKRPLTVGLAFLTQAYPGEYGMLTAGYTIAAIPLMILFLLSMRQFVEGITAGAVKL